MKKYLLVLAAGIFGILTANAYTVTDNGDGSVTIDGGQWVNTTVQDTHGVNHTAVSAGTGATGLPDSFTDDDLSKINSASKIYITGYVEKLDCFQGKTWPNITSVDMSEAHFKQDLNDVFEKTFDEYDPSATTSPYTKQVTRTYMKNTMNFSFFKSMSEAILSNYVESLCANAKCFDENTALTGTFIIPANVKYIGTHTCDNTPLTSITIPATVEYIDTQAFMNGRITSLIDVTVEGTTAAAKKAFDMEITTGQTVADGSKVFASLHFPNNATTGFFVNEDHPLSLETSLDVGAFQSWLDAHKSDNVAKNGWHEFVNSAPGDGVPVPEDNPIVLRTFSDNVAHYVPTCYRAYLVNGIKGNDTDGYTLDLVETFAIPANTGVIIYGVAASGSFALPILSGASWNTTPYTRETTTTVTVDNKTISLKNYLVANCNLPSGTKIGPYELGSDGKVTERNFVLGPYSKTDIYESQYADYMAFFRVKNITPGKNKAHLKLPSTLFKNPKGVELIPVNPSTFRETEWPKVYPGNWGTKTSPVYAKSFGEPFEDEYIPTGITNVKNENADNAAIYTLQGVKVSNNPTKGVYIQNGKKFIVK